METASSGSPTRAYRKFHSSCRSAAPKPWGSPSVGLGWPDVRNRSSALIGFRSSGFSSRPSRGRAPRRLSGSRIASRRSRPLPAARALISAVWLGERSHVIGYPSRRLVMVLLSWIRTPDPEPSNREILRAGMMTHQRAGRLLRHELEFIGERDTELLRTKQVEQDRLIL